MNYCVAAVELWLETWQVMSGRAAWRRLDKRLAPRYLGGYWIRLLPKQRFSHSRHGLLSLVVPISKAGFPVPNRPANAEFFASSAEL